MRSLSGLPRSDRGRPGAAQTAGVDRAAYYSDRPCAQLRIEVKQWRSPNASQRTPSAGVSHRRLSSDADGLRLMRGGLPFGATSWLGAGVWRWRGR